MKTWYQVLIYPKVFGFSVVNYPNVGLVIVNHPEIYWQGILLDIYKKELIKQGAIASKIC